MLTPFLSIRKKKRKLKRNQKLILLLVVIVKVLIGLINVTNIFLKEKKNPQQLKLVMYHRIKEEVQDHLIQRRKLLLLELVTYQNKLPRMIYVLYLVYMDTLLVFI